MAQHLKMLMSRDLDASLAASTARAYSRAEDKYIDGPKDFATISSNRWLARPAAVHKMTRIWEQKNIMTHSSRGRYMRLLYGLCMFHSMANFRARYGSRGGWNCIKGFDFNDLECAIEYLEVINRNCSLALYFRVT